MPTIQSAKQIAENALSTIGAFPASRSAPDPGELKKALRWLEMLLNFKTAVRPIDSFFSVFEIPIEAGIGDYDLSDYSDESGVCHVFGVFIVDASGELDPLDLEYRSRAVGENLTSTGRPQRATVNREEDVSDGTLAIFPTPTQTEVDAGLKLRVRVQTFHKSIREDGTGDQDIKIRPSWYLWATKALGYEIGSGPVRRLSEGELKRLGEDAVSMENALLARDGQNVSPKPPVTESNDVCQDYDTACTSRGYRRN